MDFQDKKLNMRFRELRKRQHQINLDIYNLGFDAFAPAKYRRAYGIDSDWLKCILVYLEGLKYKIIRELKSILDNFERVPWSNSAVVITKSFSKSVLASSPGDYRGVNKVFVRVNGETMESRIIQHCGYPLQPNLERINQISREFSERYKLPIQNNLLETGHNYIMRYEN